MAVIVAETARQHQQKLTIFDRIRSWSERRRVCLHDGEPRISPEGLHQNDWHRTIFIDASGVGTTEFSLSDAKTQMLIENGRRGVVEYFKWFEDPKAKPINRI